ncbi:hypothetical protein SDJN02_02784, partial [Cucurbita argyrosperma subsp. argyrosperma]
MNMIPQPLFPRHRIELEMQHDGDNMIEILERGASLRHFVSVGESEPSNKALFLLPQLVMLLLRLNVTGESRRSCGGGVEGTVTGGISKDSSGG